MISSAEYAEKLLQQHSDREQRLEQERIARQRKADFDRTQFAFRSNSDSKFGERKPNRQDPLRSSASSSMHPQQHQQSEFCSDPSGFKGRATMSTGHGVWDEPGTGPSNLSDYAYKNNIDQSDISAQIKIATMQSMLDKKLGPEMIAKRSAAGGCEYKDQIHKCWIEFGWVGCNVGRSGTAAFL